MLFVFDIQMTCMSAFLLQRLKLSDISGSSFFCLLETFFGSRRLKPSDVLGSSFQHSRDLLGLRRLKPSDVLGPSFQDFINLDRRMTFFPLGYFNSISFPTFVL